MQGFVAAIKSYHNGSSSSSSFFSEAMTQSDMCMASSSPDGTGDASLCGATRGSRSAGRRLFITYTGTLRPHTKKKKSVSHVQLWV